MFFWTNPRISMERSLSRGKMESKEHLRQEQRTRMLFVNFYLLAGERKKKERGWERKRPMIYFGNARKAAFFQGWIPEHFLRNRFFFQHLHLFSLKLIGFASDKRIVEIIFWTLLITQCNFDKKNSFLLFKILIICIFQLKEIYSP